MPINKKSSEKGREKILSVEDIQVKVSISREKKFTTKEKRLIRELIVQLKKSTTNK